MYSMHSPMIILLSPNRAIEASGKQRLRLRMVRNTNYPYTHYEHTIVKQDIQQRY